MRARDPPPIVKDGMDSQELSDEVGGDSGCLQFRRGWSGEGLKSTQSPIGGGVGGGAILSGGADWFDM